MGTFNIPMRHISDLLHCVLIETDLLIARSALYFRDTSPRTTDSVRSVPSVPYGFLRRFCTEDLKLSTAPWLSMLFSEDFGGDPEKYPCKVGLSSSICVTRSPVLDVFFCTFLRFFENYRFRRKRRFAPVPTRLI